jgi:hypothetical protein
MNSIIIILLILTAVAVDGNEEGDNRILDDDYDGGWREDMGEWRCFCTIANSDELLDEGIGSSGRKYSGVTMLADVDCPPAFLLEIPSSINPISLLVSSLS